MNQKHGTSNHTRVKLRFMSGFRYLSLILLFSACRVSSEQNILYSSFTDRPKYLDPVQSYIEDKNTFTAQIYESPLQYHYLKGPYTLIPATTEAVPQTSYFDDSGKALPEDAPPEAIAYSGDEIRIRPSIH